MNDALVKPIDIRLMNFASMMLGAAALALLLIYGVRWALTWPLFGVAAIVVDGDVQHNSPLTIKANIAGRIDGNFLSIDLVKTREVFESIAWVRRATVQRELPARLRVTLEEHQSSGFWGAQGDSRMINSFGEVFEANAGETDSDSLPRLIGADSEAKAVLDMYRSLSALLSGEKVLIERLEQSKQNSWSASLDSGTQLILGRGKQHDILVRLKDFLATYPSVLQTYGRSGWDRIEAVDLRNGQGYAIRIRGVTTADASAIETK